MHGAICIRSLFFADNRLFLAPSVWYLHLLDGGNVGVSAQYLRCDWFYGQSPLSITSGRKLFAIDRWIYIIIYKGKSRNRKWEEQTL